VRTLAQLDTNVWARLPPVASGPLIPSPTVQAYSGMMRPINPVPCDDAHFELGKPELMKTY
jgi:hypothetical protein